MARREEAIAPFLVPRSQVPLLKTVRSGLICSSITSLRARGHYDRYLALLPPSEVQTILSLTAGRELEPSVAEMHYDTCEKLRLRVDEQIEIGHEVAARLQKAYLSVVVRLATQSGVTPWTILAMSPRLWGRYFDGSAVAVYKLGPKEARCEAAGFQLARIPYIQNSVGGILRGIVELFCSRIYVRDIPSLCTESTLGYRLSWA